jgi:hypothetical protein
VFLNLFLNARDAMEGGGHLAIATSHRDGLVRVTVRDSGSGIAAENLARIFDPFFTTKGARKGTGLGLSVSYGIVREHGGDIEVESEPGKGACFLLVFPELVAAESRPVPVPVYSPAAPASVGAAPFTIAATTTFSAPSSTPPASVPSVQIARSDRIVQ